MNHESTKIRVIFWFVDTFTIFEIMLRNTRNGLVIFLIGALVSCKEDVNPCNCAENLKKEQNAFNHKLDADCDAYLEKLSKKEAEEWTDAMMNCISENK